MKFEEVGKLFDKIVDFYPAFSGDGDKISSWYKALKDIPFAIAEANLIRYASDPDNKFYPHPGALTQLESKSEIERYHEHMHHVGVNTLEQFNRFKKNITGPSEEQRRKVRELLGK